MPTKLQLYNEALRELGDHPLVDLVSANTRLSELDGAFTSAVEYMLAQADWNFARARATLATTTSAAFPPYAQRYAKPADYLRKCWLKAAADDVFQIEHAEVGSYFYGFTADAPLLEYVAKTSANLDPANWPPQFARTVAIYLALLVAPKLARAGDDLTQALWQKHQAAQSAAARQEAVFVVNVEVAANRLPTLRRAMEFLGQHYAGSTALQARADELRWEMNKAWAHSVRYCLDQGAWNFAAKRAILSSGAAAISTLPSDEVAGIIEGYSVPPAADAADHDFAGFDYGYPLPDDFRHKIWLKPDANWDIEAPHQMLRDWVFCNYDPVVLEYVAEDEWTTDPDHWPPTFLEVVAAYLALTAAPELVIDEGGSKARIAQPKIREALERVWLSKLSDAKVKDAVQQYPKRLPAGSFARARRGGGFAARR